MSHCCALIIGALIAGRGTVGLVIDSYLLFHTSACLFLEKSMARFTGETQRRCSGEEEMPQAFLTFLCSVLTMLNLVNSPALSKQYVIAEKGNLEAKNP